MWSCPIYHTTIAWYAMRWLKGSSLVLDAMVVCIHMSTILCNQWDVKATGPVRLARRPQPTAALGLGQCAIQLLQHTC